MGSSISDMTLQSSPPPFDSETSNLAVKRGPLWQDLLLVILACLALALLVHYAPAEGALSVVRLVVAVLFSFIVPGYSLAAVLFPQSDDLDMLERVGLSLGLSVALLPVLALILDQLGLELRLETFLWGNIFLCVLLSALALLQRLMLPVGQAYAPRLGLGIAYQWHGMDTGGRWTVVVALVFVVLVGLATAWVVNTSPTNRTTTEFYVLGPGGLAQDYPRQVIAGQQIELTGGITNLEPETKSFRVEISSQGSSLSSAGPFELEPGENRQFPLRVSLFEPGQDVQVVFSLFIDDQTQPYRRLELWLSVIEP